MDSLCIILGIMNWTRRKLLGSAILASAASLAPRSFAAIGSDRTTALIYRAKAALERHGAAIAHQDVIGVVDFAAASRNPRFHLLDMGSGKITSLLVAHGRGSDPDHSGWLQRFSNIPGSEATSSGAFLTSSPYAGKHGQSRRLIGLDPENDQAESRAIVIHGADYVGSDIIAMQGKIGRSQGCFAVAPSDLTQVMERLGEGRLLFASK
jgi:L,D-transpeptidase catalytic domain